MADEAVKQMAPALSAIAQHRMRAWLLADARGAVKILDKASAERVGKRFAAQASKVCASLLTAARVAREGRVHARA